MRILVIRFSSIGDIVLTSPVVRALRLQLGAEVHFLTKLQFGGLLIASPYLHRIHLLQNDFSETARKLHDCRFDHVIDLHNNLRTWRLRASLSAPTWHRFDKLNVEKWLLVNLKLDRLPPVHIVDRYLAAVSTLGITNDGAGLDYFIPEETVWPEAIAHLNEQRFVAVAVGAAHATKQIPVEKLKTILEMVPVPVVLLGGPGDRERAAEITRITPGDLYDLCGTTSLHQSALVVRRAACLLTPDTGLMHIAAALETPIVSVWGNTVPEFGMYPYRPDAPAAYSVHEVAGLRCRPCSKIGHASCPKGHFRCMMDQHSVEISERIMDYVREVG